MAGLANLTQVLTQSPQVSALAGGQLAAEEVARREAQIEASERLREVVSKIVAPLEETGVVTPVDPKARRERRKSAPGALKAKASRGGPPRVADDRDRRGTEVAPGPFEPRPVIDVRI